jgi:hypothetical protein
MSTYFDTLSLLPTAMQADQVLLALSALFKRHHMAFDRDTSVIFNDYEGLEKEPIAVDTEEEALEAIRSWPTLGGTAYALAGYKLIVFLYATIDYHVDAITMSVSASPYLRDPSFKSNYDELVKALHFLLQAKRTIGNYELLSPNSIWEQKVDEIRNDVFAGDYEVDLR